MSLYTRVLRHIDMDRVKELREENIKKQKIAEAKLQEEIISAELERIYAEQTKHCDWRIDLEEGMTTAGLGMINLQPNIPGPEDNKTRDADPSFTPEGTLDSNGVWTMNNAPDAGSSGISITLLLDLSRSNTFSTQVYFDNATIDPTHGMDVVFDGPVGSGLQHIVPLSVPGSGTGDANPQITIPPKFRIKDVAVTYSVIGDGGDPGAREIGNNAIRISSAVPYRSSPMNVFVSLDDPDATAFIRDTVGNQNLSPEEKKKKLEEMLGASAEYLNKMFGEGMPRTATQIADYEPQQSFTQIAAAGNPRGTGGKSAGDPENIQWPRNRPGGAQPGPGYRPPTADKGDDTVVASARDPYRTPGADAPYTHTRPKMIEVDGINKKINMDDPSQWPSILKKAGRRQPQYAHYEPEGEVIVEKKKLKSPASLLDKIPGYYDGKPAPLGFPIEEPPKMVNGKHPDLVDGKKVSKRYNRLDPISAKAMPKTGNSHIDKKVRSAANKPKLQVAQPS